MHDDKNEKKKNPQSSGYALPNAASLSEGSMMGSSHANTHACMHTQAPTHTHTKFSTKHKHTESDKQAIHDLWCILTSATAAEYV